AKRNCGEPGGLRDASFVLTVVATAVAARGIAVVAALAFVDLEVAADRAAGKRRVGADIRRSRDRAVQHGGLPRVAIADECFRAGNRIGFDRAPGVGDHAFAYGDVDAARPVVRVAERL